MDAKGLQTACIHIFIGEIVAAIFEIGRQIWRIIRMYYQRPYWSRALKQGASSLSPSCQMSKQGQQTQKFISSCEQNSPWLKRKVTELINVSFGRANNLNQINKLCKIHYFSVLLVLWWSIFRPIFSIMSALDAVLVWFKRKCTRTTFTS